MAKIKILLEHGETLEEIKEELIKAFQHEHPKPKQFQDPILEEINVKLNDRFKDTYTDMFKEIMEVIKLDEETLKDKK